MSLLVAIPGVGLLLSAQMLMLTSGLAEAPQYRPLAQRLGIAPNAYESGASVRQRSRSRGYGDGSPAAVARAVEAVVDAGAVGINLEDGTSRDEAPLLSVDEQAERIRAARAAARGRGVDLFINARTDVFLAGVGEPVGRADEAIRRAEAYLAAGASGVFVPAVLDAETVERLVRAIDGPLNVLARPGALPVPALAALGVARVSLGPGVALALVKRAAEEALASGMYTALADGLAFGDAQALFDA